MTIRTETSSAMVTLAALHGSRILVVEDEVLIAMEIASILDDYGAEVIGPSHTIEEALREAAAERVSAAVLDMYLGHSAITPVAEFLKRRGVPFLFYSGQPSSDPVRIAWNSTPMITKPARTGELARALAGLLTWPG